jgi:hypothetical protein
MRLGELLLQHRLITREQLQASLDAQVSYGGRVGTNLAQLGYLDVDVLSRMLGEQHGIGAVKRKHFAAIDKRVIALFPARVVASYKAIPLGYTQTKPSRVIVACQDPSTVPVEELSFAAGSRVDVWIAPELMIQEALETYYGVARPPGRYIDVSFTAHDPAASSGPPVSVRSPAPPSALHVPGAPRLPSATRGPLSPPTLEPPPPPSLPALASSPPSSRAAKPAAPRELSPPPPPFTREVLEERPALRLSVTELPPADDWDVPQPPSESPPPEAIEDSEARSRPITAPPGELRPFIDQSEASRMLELATSKDHIGRVLEDWLRSTFGAGLVLVVKNEMAVGWKGFFPDAEDLIEAVAVPLGKPSLFSAAFESRAPFCGEPPPEGARLNQLLWKLLRCPAPHDVLVCPVVLGSRVVNLLYAPGNDELLLSDTLAREAQVVAGAASAAYTRLIRKERGKAAK